VYAENRDDIIGFVHIRDIMRCRKCQDLHTLVREPVYAHETLHLDKLLRQMQKRKQQFCVVLDEYGVWQGILTMEDILESIVGDIQDEFDNEEPDFVKEPDGSYSISSSLSLDELAEHMDLECGSDIDMYKIIAAHFMESLERIAEPGDSIDLCGHRFTINRMDRNRILRLKVERIGTKG
jgi:putative hemolysin